MSVQGKGPRDSYFQDTAAKSAQSTESIGKEGKSVTEETMQQGSINGRGVTQGAASSGTRRSVRVYVKKLESLATTPTRPAPAHPLPGRVTVKVPARLKNNTTVFVNGKQVFGKPSRPPPPPPSHPESSPSAAKQPPGGVGDSFDKLPPDEQKMGKDLYDAKMKNDGSFQKLQGKMDPETLIKAMRSLNRYQKGKFGGLPPKEQKMGKALYDAKEKGNFKETIEQWDPATQTKAMKAFNRLQNEKEIDRADKGKAEADEAAVQDSAQEPREVGLTTASPTGESPKLGKAWEEFKQTETNFNSSMKELRDGLSGDPKLAEAFKDEIESLDQLVKASEEFLAVADSVGNASDFKQLSESKEFSNVMDSIKDLTLRFDEMGEKGNKPEIKDHIANLKFSSKNNFDGMISQPMQRSMRYGLLANSIVGKSKNPDLIQAEKNMKAAAQSVNEAKGRYDDAKAAEATREKYNSLKSDFIDLVKQSGIIKPDGKGVYGTEKKAVLSKLNFKADSEGNLKIQDKKIKKLRNKSANQKGVRQLLNKVIDARAIGLQSIRFENETGNSSSMSLKDFLVQYLAKAPNFQKSISKSPKLKELYQRALIDVMAEEYSMDGMRSLLDGLNPILKEAQRDGVEVKVWLGSDPDTGKDSFGVYTADKIFESKIPFKDYQDAVNDFRERAGKEDLTDTTILAKLIPLQKGIGALNDNLKNFLTGYVKQKYDKGPERDAILDNLAKAWPSGDEAMDAQTSWGEVLNIVLQARDNKA